MRLRDGLSVPDNRIDLLPCLVFGNWALATWGAPKQNERFFLSRGLTVPAFEWTERE